MRRTDLLGIVGVGVFAVACCAVLPALVAFAGGVGVAALLGGGVAVAVVAGIATVVLLSARRRRAKGGSS